MSNTAVVRVTATVIPQFGQHDKAIRMPACLRTANMLVRNR
jgi:hypothetical protein